jgi:hypothetical protein
MQAGADAGGDVLGVVGRRVGEEEPATRAADASHVLNHQHALHRA